MEISTTMVKFFFFKEDMKKKTEKAQLFLCGDKKKPVKVWVPLKKLEVRENEERPEYNVVVMPKWVWGKTELPFYTDPVEFIVKTEVNNL